MFRNLFGSPAARPTRSAKLGFEQLGDRVVPALLINEAFVNPPGSPDVGEYVEIKGAPGQSLTGYTVVIVEGELPGSGTPPADTGYTDGRYSLNGLSLDANGYLAIDVTIENGSASILLVKNGTTAVTAADWDTDNNGTLDAVQSGVQLIDGVGYVEAGSGDVAYGYKCENNSGTTDALSRVKTNTEAWFVDSGETNKVTPGGSSFYSGDVALSGGLYYYSPTQNDPTPGVPTGAYLTRGAENF